MSVLRERKEQSRPCSSDQERRNGERNL